MIKDIQKKYNGCAKVFFIFCFILFLPRFSFAQLNHMGDSIKHLITLKPRITGDLYSKNSFISGTGVKIKGLRLGVEYGNKLSLFLGGYFIKKPIYSQVIRNQGLSSEYILNTKLGMWYIGVSGEYIFYRTKRWQFGLTAMIGGGRFKKTYTTLNNTLFETRRHFLLPIETGINGHYKVFSWIGVAGGLGYRRALFSTTLKEDDFNGLLYSIGITFFLDGIIEKLFPDGIKFDDVKKK